MASPETSDAGAVYKFFAKDGRMSKTIAFTVYGKSEPQGSSKAFIIGGKARITSDNSKLKPFRSEVTRVAIEAVKLNAPSCVGPLFVHHEAVKATFIFHFRRPASIPKKRTEYVVKPDIDKLCRSICDGLTGVVWHDDAQVVGLYAIKVYGDVERVDICVYQA
jgi:Holliday junction resolvase RusA-like endonuclease